MAVSENLWNLLSGYMCVGFYILATERFLKYREAAQWTKEKHPYSAIYDYYLSQNRNIAEGGWKYQKKWACSWSFSWPWSRYMDTVQCLFHTWCLTFSTRDADIFRRSSYEKISPVYPYVLIDSSSICKRLAFSEEYTNISSSKVHVGSINVHCTHQVLHFFGSITSGPPVNHSLWWLTHLLFLYLCDLLRKR